MRPLTPRQSLFVKEYLVDLIATQAAIRAGYSARTAEQQGSRLLSNAKVQAAIQEEMAKRSAKVELSAEWVLTRLRENADRAMQATEVFDRKGNPTGEYVYDGSVANRALELIGKHVGMFVDRSETKLTLMADLSDAELEAQAVALKAFST